MAQQDIFFGTHDRREFLRLLEQAHERYRIVIHGYCLMTNHYHLEIETPEANLSRTMQWEAETWPYTWRESCLGVI